LTDTPPTSPLLPYTTLFRSERDQVGDEVERARRRHDDLSLGREFRRQVDDPLAGLGLVLHIEQEPIRRHDAALHVRARLVQVARSREHTPELQSLTNLTCPL